MERAVFRWVLFWLMVLTVPVLFFMFVVGGFLPLSVIAVMAYRDSVWGFKLFSVLHLLVYGALFYWLAGLAARGLSALGKTWGTVAFLCLSAGLLALAFLPLYGAGHHAYAPTSLLRLPFLRGY